MEESVTKDDFVDIREFKGLAKDIPRDFIIVEVHELSKPFEEYKITIPRIDAKFFTHFAEFTISDAKHHRRLDETPQDCYQRVDAILKTLKHRYLNCIPPFLKDGKAYKFYYAPVLK